MHNEVSWLIPQRLIRVRMVGVMTVADVAAISEAIKVLVIAGQPPVHLISDMRDLQSFPTNLKELSKVLDKKLAERTGWVVLISTNIILRFTSSMLAQFGGSKTRVFSDHQEAIVFLNDMEPSLRLTADALTETLTENHAD